MDIDLDTLRAEVREWLCNKCNRVYPGPPQAGFACVQCPKCSGQTGPRVTMELRAATGELAAARALLADVATKMMPFFTEETSQDGGKTWCKDGPGSIMDRIYSFLKGGAP